MGRYYWDSKNTVEDCRSVSISFLKRGDYFCGYRFGRIVWKNCNGEEVSSMGIEVSTTDGGNYARFYYTITNSSSGKKTDYDYKVRLTTTPCNFGGVRYWFCCPWCGRRVGALYIAPRDFYYRCRRCNNLSYRSRNLSKLDGTRRLFKASDKADELRKQIKRWTYKGRPTKKVQRLLELETKASRLSSQVLARLRRLEARLS